MARSRRARALRILVLVDDQVCEEFHQRTPASVDVGRLPNNEVHVYDAHLAPVDRTKNAPIWFGVGLLMVAAGAWIFGAEVARFAALAAEQAADVAGQEMGNYFDRGGGGGGGGGWGAALLLLGLLPLVHGFTAMREAPPPPIPKPSGKSQPAPNSHRFFVYDENNKTFTLDVPVGIDGRIIVGGKKTRIAALRKRAGGGPVSIAIAPGTKGQLEIGESILLFQFGKPAASLPILQLPAGLVAWGHHLRPTRLEFWTQLGAALVLGSFFYHYATTAPKPSPPSDRFIRVMGVIYYEDEPEEEPEEEAVEEILKQEDEDKKEVKDDEEVIEKPPEKFSAKAVEKARGVGIARVLGTWGGPGEGTALDVIENTENNLGELFAMGMTQTVYADSQDVTNFVAGGEGLTAHGAVAGNEGLNTGEGPAVDGTDKKERRVRGKLKSSTDEVYGDVDKKMVKAIIKRRMSGLKACYEKALRSRPNLEGKMAFSVNISIIGRVTNVNVDQDTVGDAKVRSCVTAKIRGWRFPAEGAEEPAEVSFSVVFSGAS